MLQFLFFGTRICLLNFHTMWVLPVLALAALLVFLSALFAYRVWKSNMAGDWIGLGFAGICAAYCHNFALVSVVAVYALLFLCALVCRRKLLKGWLIAAAGNPPEYNRSVREFDVVTLDRVRCIDVEPKLSVWQTYARAHRLHPAVTAYLELRPQHFYKLENDVDGMQFVTARGWEDLSAFLQAADKLGLDADEGVIAQYLRHPEVARDFAAYWALYRKYKKDYGVADILAGKPFDAVLQRALSAAFDERISLISLLLAGLNTRFADAQKLDAVTDACYQQLRSFKRTLSQKPDTEPAALFADQTEGYRARLELAKDADELTAAEQAARTRTLQLMQQWGKQLEPGMIGEDAFDTVRGQFNAQVRRREDAVADAGNALEFAFDFMERAFPDGQEMVVFVNELALGPDSAPFLAENECERFEQYSRKLLLQNDDELLAELQRDDLRAGEHSAEF